MSESRETLVEVLRGRILRGLQAGTLEPGGRLPSARDLVVEFSVDHRLILAAYRELADEGLVEIRERGGVYAARATTENAAATALPVKWIIDTFTDGYARELGALDVTEWLRRSIETLRLRAVVISTTEDQVYGLARELRDDFGIAADGVIGSELRGRANWPQSFKRADLIVATEAFVEVANRIGDALEKPVLVVTLRPDLAAGEWALLLRQPVWAVVATAEFGDMLRRFFADVKGIDNLTILVHGRDDLAAIPDGAPTYITHRVRAELANTPIRGRVLPPARTVSIESAHRLFEFVVRANLRATHAIRSFPPATPD